MTELLQIEEEDVSMSYDLAATVNCSHKQEKRQFGLDIKTIINNYERRNEASKENGMEAESNHCPLRCTDAARSK